jgi:DNA-binding CsgD family transcriptional regulator
MQNHRLSYCVGSKSPKVGGRRRGGWVRRRGTVGKRPMSLRTTDVMAVMRHMADVAALKSDPVTQRQLLIDGMNQIVGTDSAFFYVADEWRPGMRPHFSHYTLSQQPDPTFLRYTAEFGIAFPLDDDPYCYHSIRAPALAQTWTDRDVLPGLGGQRRHGNFMDLKASGRLADGVISFYRTGAGGDRIVGVGMHRFGSAARLRQSQVALVTLAVGEIRRLVERGHLALPPVEAWAALPPRLQQVLDRMLSGHPPTRIARELGLSVWTVREHVQRLYKHHGVSSREELMAKFVRP